MTISSINAQNFYKEVVVNGKVYTIRDKNGFPAPQTSGGKRSQPFWSLSSRAEKVIENIPAYKNFQLLEISLDEFKSNWLIGLSKNNFLVGINWSGEQATGYDIEPEEIIKNINYYLSNG